MSRATAEMRDLAERLIAYEIKRTKPVVTKLPAAFHVCEKLRPHLATLMGSTGFCAFLSRALALAVKEVPRLSTVQVKPDGTFSGLDAPGMQVHTEKLAEGGIVLVARMLGLLETFIGEDLTLRMLNEVWPKLTLSALFFGEEDQNEKEK